MIFGLAGKYGSGKSMIAKMVNPNSIRLNKQDLLTIYLAPLFNIKNFNINVTIELEYKIKDRFVNQFKNAKENVEIFKLLLNHIGIENLDEKNIQKYFNILKSYDDKDFDEYLMTIIKEIEKNITNKEDFFINTFPIIKYIDEYYKGKDIFYYIYDYEIAVLLKRLNVPVIYIDIDEHLAAQLINSFRDIKITELKNAEVIKNYEKIKNIADYVIENKFQSPEELKNKFMKIYFRLIGK